ncbi:hypothetical protein FRX31_006725 [Thalictrum thalictroides]|uniref:Ankyrin repeat-containing protein n=1 Tax=Thalictrum thalictroides TaxID=46969 RepID=A0A7J6X4D2_THATH|nr:hypothetical protein FRX31_006725 [Thalictrum thalictroides]
MDPFYNVRIGNVDYFKEVSLEVLLNSRDESGNSLLSKAVLQNDLNCVKVIYERRPSLLYCESTEHGYTALHHATFQSTRDKLEILKFLINADAESQGRGAKKRLTRMRDIYGHAALMIAVKYNKPEAVKLLYAADPDFHHPPNTSDQTPLKLCMSDSSMQGKL